MIEDQGYSGPTLNLSKNFPMFWRPVTAIIDVFTRLYFSHGVIGFLVAVVQLVIGGGLMYLLIKKTQQQWLQHPIVFLPGALVLGSLAAIPIWLFTLLVFNTIGTYLWLAGGMAELVSSFFALSWVALKVFEFLGHEAIVKRLTKLFGH